VREELNQLLDELESKLAELEAEEDKLGRALQELAPYPNLRREYRKCGKPNCHCARGQLHGPYWYAYYKQGGKTKAIYFGKNPPELPEDAISKAEYRKFAKAARELRRRREAIWKALATALDALAKAVSR